MRDEIFRKVRATLVDALGVDESEVGPDATLFKDLGAESIDLLDIIFRLERNFGIKIGRGELFPDVIVEPGLTEDGRLTAEGLRQVGQQVPHVNLGVVEADPRVETLLDLYTVDALVGFVADKLERQGDEASRL